MVVGLEPGDGRLGDVAAVDEDLLYGGDDRGDGFDGGDELVFVVGLLGDVLGDDQPTLDLGGGLGVVGLFEATFTAGGHDAAFGGGDVVFIVRIRRLRP